MVEKTDDRVRVLRLIEYEGPRSWVEDTVGRSVHGTRIIDNGRGCRITGVTLREYPEIIESARLLQYEAKSAANRASAEPSLLQRRGPVRAEGAEGCMCQQFGKSAVLTFKWDPIEPTTVVTNGKCIVCGEIASLDRAYNDNVGTLEESRRAEG